MPARLVAIVLLLSALTACAGTSELEACVQHSVDEGLSRSVSEQACREAGFGE